MNETHVQLITDLMALADMLVEPRMDDPSWFMAYTALWGRVVDAAPPGPIPPLVGEDKEC